MKSNYQHIFTPLTVKNMTIKNRIVMMPMGTNYGEQNGEMSFLHINYYKRACQRRHRSDHRRECKRRFSAGFQRNYSASY